MDWSLLPRSGQASQIRAFVQMGYGADEPSKGMEYLLEEVNLVIHGGIG